MNKGSISHNARQLGEGASEALDLCGCLALLPNCLLAVRCGLLIIKF